MNADSSDDRGASGRDGDTEVGDARRWLVDGSGNRPLPDRHGSATDRMGDGEALVLFSDGLVERRGRQPAESLVEPAQVANDAAAGRVFQSAGLSTVERVCTQTLELVLRTTWTCRRSAMPPANWSPTPSSTRTLTSVTQLASAGVTTPCPT